MVPLPIDNELDHMLCARAFIEKYALARLADRFPNLTNFLTLDLSARSKIGHCLPDFAVISVTRPLDGSPRQRLFGFELKVPAGITVDAVAQARKQKPCVDGIFLLLLLPDGYPAERSLPQIRREARREGIGVIRVRDWRFGRDYEQLESPLLSAPADEDGPSIIKGRLSSAEKAFLKRWMAA